MVSVCLFYCEILFNYIIDNKVERLNKIHVWSIFVSETSAIEMASLRNNISRTEYMFVALVKLMWYILRYTLKDWCHILWIIHCIKIIQWFLIYLCMDLFFRIWGVVTWKIIQAHMHKIHTWIYIYLIWGSRRLELFPCRLVQ